MRIHIYVLALALCAVSASPSWAQTQAQQDNSGSQTANAKQTGTASALTQSASAGVTKTAPKQAVVFRNENLKDPAANQAANTAAQDPKAAALQAKPANAQATPQAATSKSAAQPKLQIDAHKVLTNDDLEKLNKHRGMSVVGIDVDMNSIYDCDYNCYNSVRNSAGIYSPPGNLDWMRDLRSGIEDLQKDDGWRAQLVKLAHLRSRYCTIATDQNEELQKADNFNNVTDQQISIRERYNAKLSEANQAVMAEYSRASSLEATYSPLVRRFMEMQVLRIMQSACINPNSYRRPYYNSADDDPE